MVGDRLPADGVGEGGEHGHERQHEHAQVDVPAQRRDDDGTAAPTTQNSWKRVSNRANV